MHHAAILIQSTGALDHFFHTASCEMSCLIWARFSAGLITTVVAVIFLQWQLCSRCQSAVELALVRFLLGSILIAGFATSCLYLYGKWKDGELGTFAKNGT